MLTLPQIILKNLITNDTFAKRALPFIKDEYFEDQVEKQIFNKVYNFYVKFSNLPTTTALVLELDADTSVTEDQFTRAGEIFDEITKSTSKENDDWLVENTEKFCKERAMVNAIMESIRVMDDLKNNRGTKNIAAVEQLVVDALSVSFDPDIGHDYLNDADARFAEYHKVLDRLPFDLVKFNEITNGGLPKKTLSVIVGGVNVGKSLCLCHCAASALAQGKNVLYITMELAEEVVAKRIDANLLDINLDDLLIIPKSTYDSRIKKLKGSTTGKLFIKEYVSGSAHVGHFRHLLNELKLTKGFVPDFICIDSLNLCASSRVKISSNGSVNSNTYYKMVSEELRGLGQTVKVPILTATQFNRGGFASSDPGMDDMADSFAIAMTADWIISIVSNEELAAKNQYMVRQIKSRLSDSTKDSKFFIGVDRSKQRLFDITTSQAISSGSIDDEEESYTSSSSFGTRNKKRDFSDFKF